MTETTATKAIRIPATVQALPGTAVNTGWPTSFLNHRLIVGIDAQWNTKVEQIYYETGPKNVILDSNEALANRQRLPGMNGDSIPTGVSM